MNVIIVREPKESEMSLSTQVKESVNEAGKHLRDALAFAARSEHPMTINMIADLLQRLDSLECMDEIMNRFSKAKGDKEDTHSY
jgi:hypothetical protein